MSANEREIDYMTLISFWQRLELTARFFYDTYRCWTFGNKGHQWKIEKCFGDVGTRDAIASGAPQPGAPLLRRHGCAAPRFPPPIPPFAPNILNMCHFLPTASEDATAPRRHRGIYNCSPLLTLEAASDANTLHKQRVPGKQHSPKPMVNNRHRLLSESIHIHVVNIFK